METLNTDQLFEIIEETIFEEASEYSKNEVPVFNKIRNWEIETIGETSVFSLELDYNGFYLIDFNNNNNTLELEETDIFDILSVAYNQNVINLIRDDSEPREGTIWTIVFEK